MAWGAPSFLIAAILIAVPIALHLRRRRQLAPLPYSSLLFLLAAARRHARKRALRYRLLLFLRCAVIVALCLLFARPSLRSAATRVAPRAGGSSIVLVLDQSLSMAASDRGVVRFDRARERARSLLSSLGPEDHVGLVLASERPSRLTPALTTDKASLAGKLAGLAPLPVGSNNWAGLALARELLRDEAHPEIVLITDQQRCAWERPHTVGEATRTVDLHLLDVGYDGTENAAIVSLEAHPSRPAPGRTVEFQLGVARYGATLPEKLEVRARLFSEFEQTARMQVPAAGVHQLDFTAVAGADAPRVMQFHLPDDALPEDNTWLFSLAAPPQRPWRILEGNPAANSGLGSAYYLGAALRALAGEGRNVEAISPSGDWSDADLITLYGAGRLPEGDFRARLEALLARGGTALSFAPENLDADSWNAQLLEPYFGARLSPSPPAGGNRAGRLGSVDFRHPFFALWSDPRNGDPLQLSAGVSYAFASLPTRGRVAARLPGGAPALLDVKVGAGLLVFFNFAPTAEQRLDELWVSLLGEIIDSVAAASPPALAYGVGESIPLRAEAPRGVGTVVMEVEGPDGTVVPVALTPTEAPGGFAGRFIAPPRPGVYRVSPAQPQSVLGWEPQLICVNASRKDSDLSRIDRAELERLLAGYRVDWIANRAEAPSLLAAHRQGRSLEAFLLLLLAATWLLETLAGAWGIRGAPPAPVDQEAGRD